MTFGSIKNDECGVEARRDRFRELGSRVAESYALCSVEADEGGRVEGKDYGI